MVLHFLWKMENWSQSISALIQWKGCLNCKDRNMCKVRLGIPIQFIQVLLEANGLAAGKDHQFKGRYDAEKNAVIISLETDEQSALSPQKCTT